MGGEWDLLPIRKTREYEGYAGSSSGGFTGIGWDPQCPGTPQGDCPDPKTVEFDDKEQDLKSKATLGKLK